MDYSHYSILLLILSLGLLVAEVFLPSGGVLAVGVTLCLAGSIYCAYQAWWETRPSFWWGYVSCVLVLLPGVLIAAFLIFPRTNYGRHVLLEAPVPGEVNPFAREQEELRRLVGHRGKTVTMHSPGGMIEVAGRRYHSETRGMLLDAGQDIEVTALRGNRLLIRLADAPPAELLPDADPAPERLADQTVTDESPPTLRPVEPFDPFLDDQSAV